jgi:hypothetical protein
MGKSRRSSGEFPIAAGDSRRLSGGTGIAQLPAMSTTTPMLGPESRSKLRDGAPTRLSWKPSLPEAQEPKPAPPPSAEATVPYLLAPHPWPRGQFRVDPEA